MIRILVFLIMLVAVAAGMTALLSVSGTVDVRFGNWVYNSPATATLVAGFIFIILIVVLALSASYLMRLPGKIAQRRREHRRQRGVVSLTRGLEAVAAGDAADAQRHAHAAQRQLEEPSLTRLLTAQAAQLAGDHETAENAFAAMLEAPETEFLGLRGLYLQAMGAGDHKAAKEYAERAFKLRPGARWAYESVYQLSVERGAWSDARGALKLASRNGLEEGDHVKRREAALLTARAHAADAAGEKEDALKDAHDAVKLEADFPPAATLAARLEAERGHRGRAEKILQTAWVARPHPAIRAAYYNLYPDLEGAERTAKLTKLAAKKPDAPQSRQIEAEHLIAKGEYQAAISMLEEILIADPTARTFTLMASAVKALHGEAAAEPWLERAAQAPSEPRAGANGDFHYTTDGWRRLVEEYGEHARIAPPPLESISASMSRDEVRLLAAPPVPEPEPEPALEPEAEPVSGQEATGEPQDETPANDTIAPAPAAAQDYTPADENDSERELREVEAALRAAGLGGGMVEEDDKAKS